MSSTLLHPGLQLLGCRDSDFSIMQRGRSYLNRLLLVFRAFETSAFLSSMNAVYVGWGRDTQSHHSLHTPGCVVETYDIQDGKPKRYLHSTIATQTTHPGAACSEGSKRGKWKERCILWCFTVLHGAFGLYRPSAAHCGGGSRPDGVRHCVRHCLSCSRKVVSCRSHVQIRQRRQPFRDVFD